MASRVLRVAQVAAQDAAPIDGLDTGLGEGPLALVVMFVSPRADLKVLSRSLQGWRPGVPVIGCTTAGEIGQEGYDEGKIVAVGFPAGEFAAHVELIPDLANLQPQPLIDGLIQSRAALARDYAGFENECAFLMVDGLSTREDALAAALAPGLGPVPLFGGSAADGTRFLETFVLHEGSFRRNAAVLALIRTRCRLQVFKSHHLTPTPIRMVVTEADPARRIVRRINAEPAALEYARLLGKDPGQMTPFTFAAHPVLVRVGGQHYVRSIRQVADNNDLVFFSAIDEGLVLSLADAGDMVDHLQQALADLALNGEAPGDILACDCILRRIEARERQREGQLSCLLRDHRVVGFSTYGEQFNAMHVNQTLTGVAFYAPEGAG
jgi:hypothetical protein